MNIASMRFPADAEMVESLIDNASATKNFSPPLIVPTSLDCSLVLMLSKAAKCLHAFNHTFSCIIITDLNCNGSRIDIYDDKVTITFKDGQEISINE